MKGNGHVIDKIRKETVKVFKEEGLTITCEVNIQKVYFLDVMLDLQNGCYKPYHKVNSKLLYVNTGSNHPRVVLENIPFGINKRLSSISSNEESFKQEIADFQRAITSAGHDYTLDYNKGKQLKKPSNLHSTYSNGLEGVSEAGGFPCKGGSRQVIWFNPPFNIYCSTNVGELFRGIVDKNFGKGNQLSRMFNRNKLKISYSCLPNLKAKIAGHNKAILEKSRLNNVQAKTCNCQKGKVCPLEGKCVVDNVVYMAEVTTREEASGDGHLYVGLVGGPFKLRSGTLCIGKRVNYPSSSGR